MQLQLALPLLAFILFTSASASTLVCTNDFTLVNNKCLRLFTNVVTHKAAETTCQSYGSATLVTPKNAVENRAITTFVGSAASLVWIGVYCIANDLSKCLWDDATGSVEQYNSFASGFPVADIGKCVYYSTQGALAGKWLSGDCDNEPRAFVCELPATHVDTCTNNYNGNCYTLISPSTFVSAQTSCEQLCGNLATIHSANENRYISTFMNRNGYYVRIGAIQPKANLFSWIDGSLWGYNNVDTTSSYVDSCMLMSPGGSSRVPAGYWYSSTCAASYYSICKTPAGVKCSGTPPPVTVTPIPSNPSYCNSGLQLAPGIISSPNYPGNYTNNLNCAYQLTTIGSSNVQLTFTDFYTESGRDIVTIYDGAVNSSTLLATYSGSYSVFSRRSAGNQMLVTFKTDGSVVYRGFSARFTSY